jgi:hypothetical protein
MGRAGTRKEEVAGGWRRLRNEEICNLCTSPNIIIVIKLKKMGWVGHVVCMGEMKNLYKILVKAPERRDTSENLDIDGDTTLE